jgi:hypothetical protein
MFYRHSYRAVASLTTALLLTILMLPFATPVAFGGQTDGQISDENLEVKTFGEQLSEIFDDVDVSHGPGGAEGNAPPRYSYIWAPVSEFSGCGTSLGGGSWSCTPHPDSCEAGSGSTVAGTGDVLEIGAISTAPVEGVTQRGTRIDNEGGEPVDLGIRCALPGTPEYEEAPPVVIVVTQSDFARMPVDPLPAHAGPVDGWLPVNMVNVLYTEPETQLLSTELLDTPVAIRATPTSFHWDLGDGNTITTTTPGNPFPAETISATYTQEGWYDITLTTTFAGQFSVAGGPWQDIDGTIEVTSDPVPLYSKSLESRLVNGDVPVDEDEDPWVPARTPETEGPLDPRATHRTI